jgi:steroid delta-isomerase-like uncharacterized protein
LGLSSSIQPMTALELTQQYYDCFNRRDWNGMMALLSPDIRHEPNQGEARVGLEKFAEFLRHMERCYAERLTDLVFYTEPGGTRVACEFVVNGTYLQTDDGLPEATGQTYVLPAASFLTVTDGQISRVATFYNLPLWTELVSR